MGTITISLDGIDLKELSSIDINFQDSRPCVNTSTYTNENGTHTSVFKYEEDSKE